jgi:hypothetical protein
VLAGGQPARPASQRDAGAGFKFAKDLRDSFEKQTAPVRDAVAGFRKVESGFKEDTGAGDIAGVFGFMKSIDPTSTVREGEFATAENAGGVTESLMNLYNRTVKGERLTPEVRRQILSAANSQVQAVRPGYDQLSTNYNDLAVKSGVDPSQVVQPFDFPTIAVPDAPNPAVPVAQAAPSMIGGAMAAEPNLYDDAAAQEEKKKNDPYTNMFGLP